MNSRIKNLDFFKVVGCIAIVGLHLFVRSKGFGTYSEYLIFRKASQMAAHGYLAVELFFILSGFFFALNLDITKSLWQFLKKKLICFYPVLAFMLLLGYIGYAVFGLYDLSIYKLFLVLFGLNGTGLVKSGIPWSSGGSQFWYVSAMLWVFALYFYLLKHYERKNVNLVLALLVFFSYSLLVNTDRFTVLPMLGLYFKAGICRALGGIGIGYFIAQWYNNNKEYIKNLVLNIYQILFVTFLEFLCVFFIVNNLLFHKIKFDNDFIFVLVFTLAIVLFLYNKGFISRALNLNIFSFLAKYTYSIYMVHCFIIFNLHNSLWSKHKHFLFTHPMLNIVMTYILIIVFGVLVYHFIEKPAAKYLKEHWK